MFVIITFIRDKNNCKYSAYNGNYRSEKNRSSKGVKFTTIVTTSGIPLSVNIDRGNKYDSTLLNKAIDNKVINTNTKKYSKNNRYKQYFLTDKGNLLRLCLNKLTLNKI